MHWTDQANQRLNAIVIEHNQLSDSYIELEFRESAHGRLTIDHRTLQFCLHYAGERCSDLLCEIELACDFPPIELPCDPHSVRRALNKGHFAAKHENGKLLVVSATIVLPLHQDLTGYGLYRSCAQVIEQAQQIKWELLAILGEKAAECYKFGERFGNLYQWCEAHDAGGFDRWLDGLPSDAYSPGERLFFALHASQCGDRKAAAGWWQKLCDHDHWREREFVRAFIESIAKKLDQRAE